MFTYESQLEIEKEEKYKQSKKETTRVQTYNHCQEIDWETSLTNLIFDKYIKNYFEDQNA